MEKRADRGARLRGSAGHGREELPPAMNAQPVSEHVYRISPRPWPQKAAVASGNAPPGGGTP
jgi:hypothetical protein